MAITLAAIAIGRIFFLRNLAAPRPELQAPCPAARQLPLISLISPIIVVIVCYALIRVGYAEVQAVWRTAPELNDYVPMVVGLFLAMLFLQRQRPLPWTAWKGILASIRAPLMVVIVLAMQVYGAFINATLPDGTRLTGLMAGELTQIGIPVVAVIALLPFLSGLATGITVGFVGVSFPIVFNLLGSDPSAGTVLSTTALALGSGFLGVILSPIHVCLIVTNQHFKTRLHQSLAALLAPTATLMVIIYLWHIILKRMWA